MTAPTSVSRVANILADAGYRRLTVPLKIANLEFDLSAAFVGTGPSPDLILIVNTAIENEQRIHTTVVGIARALDVMQSKRPLTAVVVGPRPRSNVLNAMSEVCRVLPIGTVSRGDSDVESRNWLRVLMPLPVPESEISIVDPLKEIAAQIQGLPAEVIGLLKSAKQGAGAVQKRVIEFISEPLADTDLED